MEQRDLEPCQSLIEAQRRFMVVASRAASSTKRTCCNRRTSSHISFTIRIMRFLSRCRYEFGCIVAPSISSVSRDQQLSRYTRRDDQPPRRHPDVEFAPLPAAPPMHDATDGTHWTEVEAEPTSPMAATTSCFTSTTSSSSKWLTHLLFTVLGAVATLLSVWFLSAAGGNGDAAVGLQPPSIRPRWIDSTHSSSSLCAELIRGERMLFDWLEDDLLRSAPPRVPGRTANVSQVGVHVPCEWILDRYGSEDKLHEVMKQIDALSSSSIARLYSSDPAWRPSEHHLVRTLVRSAGILCSSAAVTNECSLPGSPIVDPMPRFDGNQGRMSVDESKRRHEWFTGLPVTSVYKDHRPNGIRLTPFNDLTGVVAALYCQSMTRYHAPFAGRTNASVYIQKGIVELPQSYAQFHEQHCTNNGATADPAASTAVGIVSSSSSPAPSEPGLMRTAVPSFASRLVPLLPSICSLASFTRPALARECLRNKRVLALGDSTMQELMQQLVDFLETPDGEDEEDLTRRKVELKPTQSATASFTNRHTASPAGSGGPMYYWLDSWAGRTSCWTTRPNEPPLSLGRVFSTAFFPSPYLAAYNITLSFRWNVEQDSCQNFRGIEGPSSMPILQDAYRYARDACLPVDAVEVAQRWRQRNDTKWRTPQEYVTAINREYPYTALGTADIDGEQRRPKARCDRAGAAYLEDAALERLSRGELYAHLSTVPGFDVVFLNMGAHYVAQWNDLKQQESDHTEYQWRPSHFSLAVERAITMAQHLAPKVIVIEMAYREASRGVQAEKVRGLRQATWEAVRQAELENQSKRWQMIQSMKKAAAALSGLVSPNTPPSTFLSSLPPAQHVYYMPRAGVSEHMNKSDTDHCSLKAIKVGFGPDDGKRTPFCYHLIQNMLELMCDA